MTTQANNPLRVAVIGAGFISDQYLRNLTSFPDIDVRGIGDRDPDRARAQAELHGLNYGGTVDEVLGDDDVELVINLTIPAAHVPVSLAILDAGKHVWTEKPLAIDRDGGKSVIDRAADLGLRVGSAPDTILGQGIQSAHRLLASGAIGEPVSATTMMQDPGIESWHPNPSFLYARGAGPIFDRGPYYYAMLAQFFGSFQTIGAVGTTATSTRVVATGPQAGEVFPVEIATNVQVIASFTGGQVAQSVYSFESPFKRLGWIEISGTEGALRVPDPSHFTGALTVTGYGTNEWTEILTPEFRAERGTGVVEMARALRASEPHRASAELGYHILDAMAATEESLETRSMVSVTSSTPELLPLPEDWDPFEATL
ncbi:Gfo/Idh/MocA family protein [Microbacterium sp. GXF0217]